jgi:hypothetical protein
MLTQLSERSHCMMSLIHTAAKNQVNIFDYFNALQRYAALVKAGPSQ